MILNEIKRIEDAKAAIRAKVPAIPQDARIDEYANYIIGGGRWHCDNPLCIESMTGTSFTFSVTDRMVDAEYSFDGVNWITARRGVTIPVSGGKVYLRCGMLQRATGTVLSTSSKLKVSGSVLSLIEWGSGELYPYCLYCALTGTWLQEVDRDLLQDLTTDPKKDSNNALAYMFSGCTSLTSAPDLPDIEYLPVSFYEYMFNGCTNLTSPPSKLEVRKKHPLNSNGYFFRNMFYGCTSLATLPELSSDSGICYYHQFENTFYGCTKITAMADMSVFSEYEGYACNNMYRGTGITEVDFTYQKAELYAFQNMFYDCTKLTEAKISGEMNKSFFSYAFYRCSSLTKITIDTSTWVNQSSWVTNVAATGEFHKKAGVTIPTGANGIPTGWTVIEDVE